MSYVNKEFEYPAELLVYPQALVGVIGLDISKFNHHRPIWDALCNNRRSERSPVRFKLFPPNWEFPRPKVKKLAYDLHIPKGILKRNWMHKHLTQIPSVIAIFYDLDWDDPRWEEKTNECVSLVQQVRTSLEGRNCKICLVLIQNNSRFPVPAEDGLEVERAKAIYQAASLGSKALFILPHKENLSGYTSNLEKAFFDLATSYYQVEMRSVKSHREFMNKTTHQYLYVRHQFKLGFFSELRQDLHSAHVFYSEAYNNLLEVRVSDTNEFEVKTVAGYIEYKVCRVLFCQNKPRDAISQFRAHIEHYKQKKGHVHLIFQHFTWLSKQYSVFADLLDEMIQQGLHAGSTQHPGIYYKQAAKLAIQRREYAQEICSAVTVYPEPDPLVGWDQLEFYGQRAWRPCKLSAEPLDPDMERLGILALQYIENTTDISSIIIGLLGNAISQFKKYRCLRMRRSLVVMMADEYFVSKEYGKALTLVMHMLYDYREENWSMLVSKLLRRGLSSSYLTASVSDYIHLCFEALSRFSGSEASRILENLTKVTQGKMPDKEPDVNDDECDKVKTLWSVPPKSANNFAIDTSLFNSPIQIKAVIENHCYDSVVIKIYIKCCLPNSFQFSFLKVTFTCASVAHEIKVADECDLQFSGMLQLKEFTYSFVPEPQDVGKPLQINDVLLGLSQISSRMAVLKFSGNGVDNTTINIPELLFFKQLSGIEKEFAQIKPRLSCIISRRKALLSVTIDATSVAMMNEWYPVRVNLINNEPSTANQTVFSFNISQGADCEIINMQTKEKLTLPLTLPLGDMLPGASLNQGFYIKMPTLEARNLDFKVSYSVDGACLIETSFQTEVVEAFKVESKFTGLLFEPLKKLRERETCLFHVTITSQSPVPIVFSSTSFRLNPWISICGSYVDVLKGECLKNCEVGCISVALLPLPEVTRSLEPGELVICWSRQGESEVTETIIKLPSIEVEETPITISLTTKSVGNVMSLLPIKYEMTNHSPYLLTLTLTVDASPSFMFSGQKHMVLHIQPGASKKLKYYLFPLFCGVLSLPKLKLTPSSDCQKIANLPDLNELIERTLPPTIFILPKEKVKEPCDEPTTPSNM